MTHGGSLVLKPKIKISCPRCGIDLPCEVRDFRENNASWAFTAKSFEHLKAANCSAPSNQPVLLGEHRTTCKEAA
ncbi:hypothetical protein PP914_gp131 [Arthrobacter phage Qui]|uniref:Uncharacterized protein n=1 Tax=Arthrobacter phage Qui TaxID=2603260 RepID=A0A5B8WFP2_9CAUD|nr:hypothetical protein PP914_gp131 [Arthrobacter phage Qui]QED11620.1 hypothetical protein SEA_QUI_131 [Arthrobacter phage Qui]QOC56452.1 hypothetical protein SEA_PAELLA_131 [Arthrobacter phage Paella]